nr:reverse transcriptase domain, reverse transcriptase zinc-binding domain protein [Tanacetum cinerariifolium]
MEEVQNKVKVKRTRFRELISMRGEEANISAAKERYKDAKREAKKENYEDVYFSGCFDVGGSRIGCDWIDEHVSYDDHSLLDISKAGFSKKALLDYGRPSLATSLSYVLKKKGKSRVKFTRKRAILKRSKMLNLRKGVRSHNVKAGVAKIDACRSNYGSLVIFIGLNEDVYDLPMFCHGDIVSVSVVKKAIEDFGVIFSLLYNYTKSSIIFGSISMEDKQCILDNVHFKVEKLYVMYLGVPLTS